MSKKIYIVNTPLTHGEADETGKVVKKSEAYEKGDEIELQDIHAEPLLAVGAISDPAEVKAAKPERTAKKVERATVHKK